MTGQHLNNLQLWAVSPQSHQWRGHQARAGSRAEQWQQSWSQLLWRAQPPHWGYTHERTQKATGHHEAYLRSMRIPLDSMGLQWCESFRGARVAWDQGRCKSLKRASPRQEEHHNQRNNGHPQRLFPVTADARQASLLQATDWRNLYGMPRRHPGPSTALAYSKRKGRTEGREGTWMSCHLWQRVLAARQRGRSRPWRAAPARWGRWGWMPVWWVSQWTPPWDSWPWSNVRSSAIFQWPAQALLGLTRCVPPIIASP